ncbi:craniofacial development protein 1 [Ipomoea triloba]|uniref:craniofacial development protein 1 n=1 Tax=Ipomoea triloba TaxID=35885 RepID=UPI00125D38C1|nr:craniofacial development protein 1 [Ipomoea triloba]
MAELTAQAQPVHSALENKDGIRTGSNQEVAHNHTSETHPEETERKARVAAVWQQMNKGVPLKTLNSILQKHSAPVKSSPVKSSKASSNWMTVLGLAPKKAPSPVQSAPEKHPTITHPETSEDAKKLAAAALSAVKDAVTAAASSNRGKIEVSEVRDFAGEEIEVKKYIDASSKEASNKGKAQAGPASAVDAVLEQIRKKQKLSVLDKTKKDWVEYKGDNKGVEEELDAYKKSSNQYLDKVSFLERADYREFERERDARLAVQAKRRPDMREDF